MGRRGGFKRKTLADKINEIDPNFVTEVYSMRDADLDTKLATMAKARSETEEAQKADVDIITAKAGLKTLNETYTEPLKALKLKTKFIVQILKDRGRDVGSAVVKSSEGVGA